VKKGIIAVLTCVALGFMLKSIKLFFGYLKSVVLGGSCFADTTVAVLDQAEMIVLFIMVLLFVLLIVLLIAEVADR